MEETTEILLYKLQAITRCKENDKEMDNSKDFEAYWSKYKLRKGYQLVQGMIYGYSSDLCECRDGYSKWQHGSDSDCCTSAVLNRGLWIHKNVEVVTLEPIWP
ncbi:unnamed protein product [Vicia faba]|uniref:Uncharacterized protein n=1 Tax=Vicia faba TaxID=3906 RepID=A0AAV0Z370_VICFA|nr:unnamed protein product [Vicia faba]